MARPKKTSATADPAREPVSAPSVTRETLEDTPERVVVFLRGVGTTPAIHGILYSRGYTYADHSEGWRLLHAASGFVSDELGSSAAASDPRVRDAIVELDGLDETFVRIISASLRRRFPDLAEHVLDGVAPATGVGAVVVVAKLLDRVERLEKKGERGKAALALIDKRGYDAKERERLRGLITVAQSVPDVVPVDAESAAAMEQAYLDALTRLRAWFEEWSEIARSTVKRRGHLIRLGLASRRTKAASKTTDEQDATA